LFSTLWTFPARIEICLEFLRGLGELPVVTVLAAPYDILWFVRSSPVEGDLVVEFGITLRQTDVAVEALQRLASQVLGGENTPCSECAGFIVEAERLALINPLEVGLRHTKYGGYPSSESAYPLLS
jgi:hypothetical protein